MSERHVPPRPIVRRGRHASARPSVLAWFDLLHVNPRRIPLHAAILAAGVAAASLTFLANRPGPATPAVSDAALSAAPVAAPEPAPEVVAEQSAPVQLEVAPPVTTYVVEAGDTLKAVAERFGVSVATIAAANKLDDPDLISVGQELTVPGTNGLLAAINPGETIRQVAERHGVDAVAVASANGIAPEVDRPLVGQKLLVPGIEPTIEQKSSPRPASADGETAERSESRPSGGLASTIITSEEGEGAAEATAAQAAERPAAAKSPVLYEVQEGDSIRSLANQFGVSVRTILLANDIDDPDLIKPGTELRVLPVSGVEHEVEPGESLADIAAAYKVDLGPVIDFNGLGDPDTIRVGTKLLIPGATARVSTVAAPAAAPAAAAAPRVTSPAPGSAVAALPPTSSSGAGTAPKPAAPAAGTAPKPAAPAAAPAPARVVPEASVGGGSASIVKNAMAYQGSRYVFGGTSPAGFDCSGFVYYIHKISGVSVSRGLWGQLNGGPRISRESLQPGDTVFFANTYMPGLSHVGIYIGGGSFIHAIDESSGVGISSLSSAYWSSRYIGATRLR